MVMTGVWVYQRSSPIAATVNLVPAMATGPTGGTLAWLGVLTLLWAALVWLSPEGACLVFPPISTRPSRPTPRGSAAAR